MIIKLGIEIELAGKITDRTQSVINSFGGLWQLYRDPSVKCKHALNGRSYNNICADCRDKGVTQIELRTTNKTYRVNTNNIEASITEISNDYKKILDTIKLKDINKSSGIHIHFSGLKKNSVILSSEFFESVHNKYKAFCRNQAERDRLTNHFCRWYYTERNDGERYRAINVFGAYRRHKTTEFRFLPSTGNITTFKRYIKFILEILSNVANTIYEPVKTEVKINEVEADKNITLFV